MRINPKLHKVYSMEVTTNDVTYQGYYYVDIMDIDIRKIINWWATDPQNIPVFIIVTQTTNYIRLLSSQKNRTLKFFYMV